MAEKAVELRAMVWVIEVAKFVGDNVINALPGGADKVTVEKEATCRCKAAPALFEGANFEGGLLIAHVFKGLEAAVQALF